MKHKIIVGFEILLAFVILATGGLVFANSEAGGSSDPLVTRSYVDDKINKALEKINSSSTSEETSTQTPTKPSTYVPVYVTVGQTLIGKEGTEIILRSGKGTVVIPAQEGISNITIGQDLKKDDTIAKNHLLIIPRDDGRGIKITENAWFLVKGEYIIR